MSELKGDLISIHEGVYCKMLHNGASDDDLKCNKVDDSLCLSSLFVKVIVCKPIIILQKV